MILRRHRPPDRVVSWSIQILARFLLIFWISRLPWAGAQEVFEGCPVDVGCSCIYAAITCKNRGYTELPDDLPVWTQDLFLPKNFIANISTESLKRLPPNLHVLDLAHNRLTFPSDGRIEWPQNLQELNLRHNRITKITKNCLLGLKSLTELDLSHNRITEVQSLAFKDLKQLRKIRLNNNKIDYLPDGTMFGLERMRELHLQNNLLTEIRKGYMFHIHALEKANFSNNRIEKIGEGIWGQEGASIVKMIDLSSNRLSHIEASTFRSDKGTIERIVLKRNVITQIDDGAFRHLANLKNLDVSHNVIGDVFDSPGAPFSRLPSLQILRLIDVDVAIISNRSFVQLPQLKKLDLLGNELRFIEPDTFNLIQSNESLNIQMQSESFLCDCQIDKFLMDFRSDDRFTWSNLACNFPPELRGKALKELRNYQLKCYPGMTATIVQDPQPVTATTGSNITLSCIIKSPPQIPTYIRWTKNGNFITDLESGTSAAIDGKSTSSLYLIDVSPDEAGEYSCMAHNIFKKVYSRPARVIIEEPPSFKKVPQSLVTVRPGEKARLGECSANGFPSPDVWWQKDGGTTFLAAVQLRVNYQIGVDWVEIAGVKLEDAGVYTCHAKNSAGEILTNVTLVVQNFTETSLPLTMSKRSHTVKAKHTGENVKLDCPNQTNWTRVLWYKNDSMLEESETTRRVVLQDGLVIKNLTEQDSGFFECEEALMGQKGPSFMLQVSKKPLGANGTKPFDWWGMDNTTFWIGVAVLAAVFLGLSVTLIAVGVIYCGRKRSGSGGSSTRSEETALPDECNPINGLHPSVDSNLDSPMTEYTEYTPVASEYSVGDGRFLIPNNGGTFGVPGSQARCKSYGESLAESQSFGNYLTLKPAPNIQSSYSPVPQRSYLTMPRVTRI